MKNLVMGVAKGYDWYALEPFVTSCKKNCPDAELVLFVDDISDFTRDRLRRGGVELVDFPDEPHGIPNNTRWKILGDWLELHGADYEQVFAIDTRDAVFQSDVFAPFANLTNWLGYVTEGDNIRGSKSGNHINYDWLLGCFDAAEAERLADKKIICSGTVIGSTDALKIFCREQWKILAHKTTKIFDQATMNYLVYNNLLPIENLIEIDVTSGEIFTSYLFHERHPVETRGDFILRGDGEVPAVVHQYDRQKSLVQLVDKIYRDKNFQADENFRDVRSVLEQAEHLLHVNKLNDATRLCLNLPDNANFDGQIDRLLRIWSFVLQRPLNPAVGYFELMIQNALRGTKFLPDNQFNAVISLLIHSVQSKRAVDMNFKIFVANILFGAAEQNLKAGNSKACFDFIGAINNLELPPTRDTQLFFAEAYRTFGRKAEAIAAYTKALDLS